MNETAGGLRELHQLHIRLRALHERLERGPKQLAARQQFIERKKAELETRREALKQQRMAADQKGLQLKTNEGKIAELRSKLNAAASNREYDVIRGQIDADTMANSVLEDEILEVLDKIDQAQVELGRLDAEIAEAESERQRQAAQFQAAEEGLRAEVEQLQAELRAVERTLPGEVAAVYRRLVQGHGADALATVEDRACGNCYVGLTPQMLVELNSGKMIFCKSCGRLLYPAERS